LKNKIKIINEGNLRTPTDDYLEWVTCIDDTKNQRSPFIIVRDNEIAVYYTVFDLEINAKEDDIIFQTWKGKWSDDVFKFKIKELDNYKKRKWEKEHGIPYPKPKKPTAQEKKKRKKEADDFREKLALKKTKEETLDSLVNLIVKYMPTGENNEI